MNDTERVADLEAQITRLQTYVEELEFTIRGEYPYADEMITEDRAKYLHPGDLDPIGGEQ